MPDLYSPTLQSNLLPLALVSLPALLFLAMLPFWSSKNHLPVKGRLVVITGASQGMGLSVAQQLSAKGAHIAIIARDESKLSSALELIRQSASDAPTQKFAYFSADLTDPSAVKRVFDDIVDWHGGVPDIVWTCAGAARLGLLVDCEPEHLQAQMTTNYLTALYTAHTSLRLMVANPLPPSAPKRHIIFTSSVIAFSSFAGYTPYAPAKAALRSLADTLRQECLLYDINIACCFPATIFSPGYEIEQQTKPGITKKLEEADGGQTPDEVARVCIRKLERGDGLVVTSFVGWAMRAAAWGGSKRNSFVKDTIGAWIISLVWAFVGWEMDGKVRAWREKVMHGGRP